MTQTTDGVGAEDNEPEVERERKKENDEVS